MGQQLCFCGSRTTNHLSAGSICLRDSDERTEEMGSGHGVAAPAKRRRSERAREMSSAVYEETAVGRPKEGSRVLTSAMGR